MKILISTLTGLILGMNAYATDLNKCEPIERDQFTIKIIEQGPWRNQFFVEFFIKGESIGKDEVIYRPLIVGGDLSGKNLYYRNSYHREESMVIDIANDRCYTF
jgi:hypothetical protein